MKLSQNSKIRKRRSERGDVILPTTVCNHFLGGEMQSSSCDTSHPSLWQRTMEPSPGKQSTKTLTPTPQKYPITTITTITTSPTEQWKNTPQIDQPLWAGHGTGPKAWQSLWLLRHVNSLDLHRWPGHCEEDPGQELWQLLLTSAHLFQSEV